MTYNILGTNASWRQATFSMLIAPYQGHFASLVVFPRIKVFAIYDSLPGGTASVPNCRVSHVWLI